MLNKNNIFDYTDAISVMTNDDAIKQIESDLKKAQEELLNAVKEYEQKCTAMDSAIRIVFAHEEGKRNIARLAQFMGKVRMVSSLRNYLSSLLS